MLFYSVCVFVYIFGTRVLFALLIGVQGCLLDWNDFQLHGNDEGWQIVVKSCRLNQWREVNFLMLKM